MRNTLDRAVDLSQTEYEGTLVHVFASVDEDGNLIVVGHDIGPDPGAPSGHEAYDHWIVVGEENKDLVLLELLRERFLFAGAPTAEFLDWLEDHGIGHELGTAAGEHRGRARISAKGRRRNSRRRSKPTRAGP